MPNEDIVRSYLDAWDAHDPERVAGHFAEHGVRHWQVVLPPMIGGPTRFQGRSEIAAGVKAFMDAVPDMRVEAENVVETDWGAIAEWRVLATHTGSWGGWSGQGEAVDLPGVSFYRINDGAIDEERMHFDPDMMAREWVPKLGTLMGVGVKMWKQGRATRRERKAIPSR
jgi:predicted ester cyclase